MLNANVNQLLDARLPRARLEARTPLVDGRAGTDAGAGAGKVQGAPSALISPEPSAARAQARLGGLNDGGFPFEDLKGGSAAFDRVAGGTQQGSLPVSGSEMLWKLDRLFRHELGTLVL